LPYYPKVVFLPVDIGVKLPVSIVEAKPLFFRACLIASSPVSGETIGAGAGFGTDGGFGGLENRPPINYSLMYDRWV
jgi:hypothetical protein